VNVARAEVVLPCADLAATVAFFVERLAFRVDAVHPAEDPRVVVVSGHGVRLRLERSDERAACTLRLTCDRAGELVAPNGARVILATAEEVQVPALRASFVLSRVADARWIEGRAGMQYRDLIPDRQGGRFIASHIRLGAGGPVADYVHFHDVRFQIIYCAKGWVRVVYEDQGAPFVMHAGDCVLQPPRIRHRVLESAPGTEVVEVGSPAEHPTFADHDLALPTNHVRADRDFAGQRFVRHEVARAVWTSAGGIDARDLGIAEGTRGAAGARVLRTAARLVENGHSRELLLRFVLSGGATLRCDGRDAVDLVAGDAFVIQAGVAHEVAAKGGVELLEISAPTASDPAPRPAP
jgi:quercetin dioxygenase-like cupin family protein